MGRDKNHELRNFVIEALTANMSVREIAELHGTTTWNIYQLLARMEAEGSVEKVHRGDYRVAGSHGKGKNHSAAPAQTKNVDVPAFLRQRDAVTIFIEKSPIEIENAIRLEIKVGDQWFAMPVTSDIRICVGDDVPRWSATQETYYNVSCYRLTFKGGKQDTYNHRIDVPFTVDAKR